MKIVTNIKCCDAILSKIDNMLYPINIGQEITIAVGNKSVLTKVSNVHDIILETSIQRNIEVIIKNTNV